MSGSQITRFPLTLEGETTAVGTAGELAIVLDVLQGNHDRAVLEQLRPHLAGIIATPGGFVATMKSLEPENQILLVDAIGPELARLLAKSTYLAEVLATLAAPAVEDAILDTLGTAGLRALVATAYDLANILQWVYGRSDQKVLDLLGADYVRTLVRTSTDLGHVLTALEADTQEALLEQLGAARVVEIVRDGRELACVLRALPARHSTRLLAHYSRAQLIALVGNAHDWEYLWARLEPAEQTAIQQKLGAG